MDLGRILDSTPEPSLTDSILLNGATHNQDGDYCLPVPMTDVQKELTEQVISAHYSDILKFFETNEPVMAESLNTLYVNAQLVATHPFLLVDHYLPKNLLLKEMPFRLQESSGKFKVLSDILELIKKSKFTVALVSRPGKSLDLIEAFLLGKLVNYKRHSGSNLRDPGEIDPQYSTIHLIPSSELDSTYLGDESFDLIIAFDQTFSLSDTHITSIRTHNRLTPVPIIRLIPYNSVEHVCLKVDEGPSGDVDGVFLRRVLAAVVVLRGKVGVIPGDLKPIYSHGLRQLSPWFAHLDSPWPLVDLPDIAEYTASDVEKSLLIEVNRNRDRTLSTDKPSSSSDYYLAKRLKRDSEVIAEAAEDSFGLELRDRHRTVLTHAIVQQLEELLKENSNQADEIESFREVASSRQAQLEAVLETMAYKVRHIGELENKLRVAERRVERCVADTEKANEKAQVLAAELAEVKQAFQDGPPELSTLDSLRQRASELEAELKKGQEKIESKDAENEYMRAEYQKASSAAVELNSKVTNLENTNKILEHKVETETARLKLLTFDEERLQKDDQIKELTNRVNMLEEHLKRVTSSEKPNSNSRSRYTSRASSVPRRTRSPGSYSRIGSPMNGNGEATGHPLQRSMNV
jgi:hypothetical protein